MFVVVAYIKGLDGKLTPWLREGWLREEATFSDLRKASWSRVEARLHAVMEIEEGADEVSIYELAGIDDARKAIDASKMGEGILVEVRVRHATPKEILQAQLAESEDPVAKEAEEIARQWLKAYAVAHKWLKLPAKRHVAKDKDDWLGPKYSTFGEALEAFVVSATPAHKFVMERDGEPWPFEPNSGESVRDAILREATRRVIVPEGLVFDEGGGRVRVVMGCGGRRQRTLAPFGEEARTPVRGRPAGMRRPIGQDDVKLAPAGLAIGLGAVVTDKRLGVGLRQTAGFLAAAEPSQYHGCHYHGTDALAAECSRPWWQRMASG